MSNEPKWIKKVVPLVLFAFLILGLAIVAALGVYWYHFDRQPDQPIQYSHNIHVNKLEMECTDCHQYADQGPKAGIPSMQLCMDCHESAATDREEIKKLTDYWNRKEPVPWVKVHRQNWHVFFTHKRHVNAGIDCTVCHGEVRAMTTGRKVRSLDMGWCVNCHRKNDAPTDCLTCHK